MTSTKNDTAYNAWYRRNILHLVECEKCGHLLQIIAVDSAKHKIIEPCQPCCLAWRTKHQLAAKKQNKICDECGSILTVNKETKSKRCKNCGEIYV